jgi:hypothetical protein
MSFTVLQLARIFSTLIIPQVSYPVSDVSVGTWTPSSGTTLYPMLADASDSTYIRSSTGSTSDVAEVALEPLSTPVSGTVTIHVRHRAV